MKNHLDEEINKAISSEDSVETLTAIHSQLFDEISVLNQNYGYRSSRTATTPVAASRLCDFCAPKPYVRTPKAL
ncbi:MAG: hypothetical protein PUD52_09015 [Prevotella sp.]|nr:hypothetical protein [Prevotella sp.]